MGDISDVTRGLAEEAYKMTLEHLDKLDQKEEILQNIIDHRTKRVKQLEQNVDELHATISALEAATQSKATVVSPPQPQFMPEPPSPWCRWCWPAAGLYYHHRITHACSERATCPCTGPHMPS